MALLTRWIMRVGFSSPLHTSRICIRSVIRFWDLTVLLFCSTIRLHERTENTVIQAKKRGQNHDIKDDITVFSSSQSGQIVSQCFEFHPVTCIPYSPASEVRGKISNKPFPLQHCCFDPPLKTSYLTYPLSKDAITNALIDPQFLIGWPTQAQCCSDTGRSLSELGICCIQQRYYAHQHRGALLHVANLCCLKAWEDGHCH